MVRYKVMECCRINEELHVTVFVFASLCGNVTRAGIIYLVRPNTHTHTQGQSHFFRLSGLLCRRGVQWHSQIYYLPATALVSI